jgi:hypothetical protein
MISQRSKLFVLAPSIAMGGVVLATLTGCPAQQAAPGEPAPKTQPAAPQRMTVVQPAECPPLPKPLIAPPAGDAAPKSVAELTARRKAALERREAAQLALGKAEVGSEGWVQAAGDRANAEEDVVAHEQAEAAFRAAFKEVGEANALAIAGYVLAGAKTAAEAKNRQFTLYDELAANAAKARRADGQPCSDSDGALVAIDQAASAGQTEAALEQIAAVRARCLPEPLATRLAALEAKAQGGTVSSPVKMLPAGVTLDPTTSQNLLDEAKAAAMAGDWANAFQIGRTVRDRGSGAAQTEAARVVKGWADTEVEKVRSEAARVFLAGKNAKAPAARQEAFRKAEEQLEGALRAYPESGLLMKLRQNLDSVRAARK